MIWYLNDCQSVAVDSDKTRVTFRNVSADGRIHYFNLISDEYENFNDCLNFIFCGNTTLDTDGDYWLGTKVWLYNDGYKKARLYLRHFLRRPFFIFYDLRNYFHHIHRKVLSFLRSKEDTNVAYNKRSTVGRRKRRSSKTGDHSDVLTKRANPNEMCREFGFTIPREESSVQAEETLHEEAEDADMCDGGNSSAIFSTRSNTSSWRENDEDCSVSDLSEGEPTFAIDKPTLVCDCLDCEK